MKKLKLKPTVLIYSLNTKSITLRYCSELIHIDDEYGDLTFFFSLLDGRFSESEIHHEFSRKYSEKYADRVFDYFETLKELRLVEYTHHKSSLDEYSMQRWSRNFEFFNTMLTVEESKYAPQEFIGGARVCLLGCGGLGSHILLELAALGVRDVVIADFDTIELSNLNRQILYYEDDIGMKKVFTARERIKKFSPTMSVAAVEKKIGSAGDIEEIAAGSNLVICVADKPRNSIVTWLNSACCNLNIPFINGGLDTRTATFYSVIPGVSGCVECWRSTIPDESIQSQIINQDHEVNKDYLAPAPALSALVSVTAGVMVSEAIKLLTKIQEPSLTNKSKCFSFDSLEISTVETWSRKTECLCCGGRG
ncbi:HesA/MoeB/ThiF family protein [[Enterobacter] lignolyticus]|uniref:HesA/MoeB/ThiF family protein n=1 Tax=[Enterobacter] lignolyticus TaxID=1334193 RepID=UPI00090061AF|nr:ThiF family adenylyltransferase [[Enterobacter] lignolyticus]